MTEPRRTYTVWHEPAVQVGDEVTRRQLLARGVTNVYFQANIVIFTVTVFIAGIMMGIGMAAVYRHIPDYFPNDVGVVGGMVGVLGGLGGFFGPVIFGYLLRSTGIWTTSWMFLAIVSAVSLVWMHLVIQRMMRTRVPTEMREIENEGISYPGTDQSLDPVSRNEKRTVRRFDICKRQGLATR